MSGIPWSRTGKALVARGASSSDLLAFAGARWHFPSSQGSDFLIKLLLRFLFCVQPEGNERPSKEKTFPCFSLPKTSGKERTAAQPERRSPCACSSYSLGKAGADPKSTQLFLGGFLVHRGSTGCSPLIHKMSHHPTKFAPFPRVS